MAIKNTIRPTSNARTSAATPPTDVRHYSRRKFDIPLDKLSLI